MKDDQERRVKLKEERIKHQLEIQSQQIERVFSHHEMQAQVMGGELHSASTRFNLQSQVAAGWSRLKELTDDLKAALGVPHLQLTGEGGLFQLRLQHPEDVPVSLLELQMLMKEMSPQTAVLGLMADGSPLLLDFNDLAIPHILILGAAAAGKSALIRATATSLALSNKQSQLQLLLMAPAANGRQSEYETLAPVSFFPHMLAPVSYAQEETNELMQFLALEMEHRQRGMVAFPKIIGMLDNVDHYLAAGGAAAETLISKIVARGAEVGIHLLLSAREPMPLLQDTVLKRNLALRIIGRYPQTAAGLTEAGIDADEAESLLGKGDFVAVFDDQQLYFQAAYIGNYDLHLTIKRLQGRTKAVLRAQSLPAHGKPVDSQEKSQAQAADDEQQAFHFDGQRVDWQAHVPGPDWKPDQTETED